MDKTQAHKLIEQNLRVYNTIAKHFSDTRQYVWEELKPLSAFVAPGDTVLDLGCGNGRLYQIFQDLPISYIGVDQSEELLVLAKKQFQKGRFVPGSMLKIPVQDHTINVIFCIAAFQHIPGREMQLEALIEMKRLLRPGGKLVMSNWNLYGAWGLKQVQTGKYTKIDAGDFLVPWRDASGAIVGERYYHGFTIEELAGLFAEAGFTVQDQYYVKKGEHSDQEKGENIISVVTL